MRLGEGWRRLFFWLRRNRISEELEEEMRLHLELRTARLSDQGLRPEDARAAARQQFGNRTLLQEVSRDEWGWTWIERLWQDLRYGVRILRKNPGFASVATLTLALGIAVNTTFFSVINGLLLRPPENVESPERLASLFQTLDQKSDNYVPVWSYPDYMFYRENNQAFSGVAAYSPAFLTIGTEGENRQVVGDIVSGNYFAVLGTKAFLGRLAMPERDDTSGSARVAVLSYEFWHDRLGADHSLIGSTIRVNTQPFTVIGITPKGTTDVGVQLAPAVWVPLGAQSSLGWPPGEDHALENRGTGWLTVLGRLNPGFTREQASASLTPLAHELQQNFPTIERGRRVSVEPATAMPPSMRGALFGFVGLVQMFGGLLLLIPCANVASLMLARASTREAEMAIRAAIGASRWRIARQLLTESMLIALCSGAIGFLVSFWWTEALMKLPVPFGVPIHIALQPDLRVLAFTLLIVIATVLLFGMGPALHLSRVSLARSAGRQTGTGIRRRSWKQRMLVVAQIGISLPLLLGAGLCVRSLRKAEQINPGFETENILVFSVSPRSNGYSDSRATAFYSDLLEGLRRIRGVQSVSLTALLPLSYGELQENVEVRNGPAAPQQVAVSENLVAPDYFRTLGVAIIRGRAFQSERDRLDVVINETLARSFFQGQDPIGRQLKVGGGRDARWLQIIGIARDSKYRTLGESPRALFYALLTAGVEGPTGTAVLVRTFGAPNGLIPAIRSQVHALDSNLPVPRIETMSEHVSSALWLARTSAALFAVLGVMGAFLAMIGLYGTVAYSVSRRTNEIGVRMALGAERADILKMIEGEGLLLACMGIGIGLAAAFGLTRFLSSLLYGVSATDPITFAAVSILFTVVALAACYIPAKRATRIDPIVALRYE